MTDKSYTPWALARMAECMDPDAIDSVGAKWLDMVAGDAVTLIEEMGDAGDNDYSDAIGERADALVPIYTHERFRIFVDLGAYREDIAELGYEGADMEQAAGVALYMVAERLLRAIVEERSDDDEEGEDA